MTKNMLEIGKGAESLQNFRTWLESNTNGFIIENSLEYLG